MDSEVILSFWPQKENSPYSRELTLTQSWPLTLISALGTYNIHQLSPYRVTAHIDKPHSNKHQETPWAEKNWKNSIHLNISTQFSYMMCSSKYFFRFYFCHAMLLILHIFGITCRSILSMCVCVCVCVQLCCGIYSLLCPLLCHLQYGGQNWQVPHTHKYMVQMETSDSKRTRCSCHEKKGLMKRLNLWIKTKKPNGFWKRKVYVLGQYKHININMDNFIKRFCLCVWLRLIVKTEATCIVKTISRSP